MADQYTADTRALKSEAGAASERARANHLTPQAAKTPREVKEQREKLSLSPYAICAVESRGRREAEPACYVRTYFERDIGRILYSLDFRRLRGKTQVFFNPKNDHICTRMEHVFYVRYIAKTIGSALGLNQDLIEAIALAHDIGHSPFGHSGERQLSKSLKAAGADFRFQHEEHSLRVLDVLAERGKKRGLNLSFEVRDGVRSHCGEAYEEAILIPRRDKTEEDLHRPGLKDQPATLEGCCVRLADRIAYVGRDIEDARRAGLIDFSDMPEALKKTLGQTNTEVINTLVSDVVMQSLNSDALRLSPEIAEALSELLQFNMKWIYRSPKILAYEQMALNCLSSLFDIFYQEMQDPERLAAREEAPLLRFHRYLLEHPEPEASDLRKLADYLAGMTDHYAYECFEALYAI
ncbi:MAG: HD domain-containing protein [Eubacteriales bacterium]|nr:HD domain-containing protein [Eubacteriales bacterium]